MAWDKGGVIHSPALSSGCTMNLLPDKHISYLEYPRHTNKHGFLSKIWEINENCWDEKLQGLVAGLLSLSSFLIPFIDHVYLQWDSPALYQFSLLSYCSFSDPWNLGFLCVLGATGCTEPRKEKRVQGTQKCVLAKGFNLASPSVLAASCEGGHLQMCWPQVSPSTGNVKFLRAAENLPVKLLSCLQAAEQRPWLAIFLYFEYFVVLNLLAAPLPPELAVSAGRCCSLGVLLNLWAANPCVPCK